MHFNSSDPSERSKAMSEANFARIVGAITEGKYSWACVLILQSAGYNPLHYIPYRTYNRLMKSNAAGRDKKQLSRAQSGSSCGTERSRQISDLNHIGLAKNSQTIRGRGIAPIQSVFNFSLQQSRQF
jgi:hypothetical protein